MRYMNEPDPNADKIINGDWAGDESIWWQSKCRQALGNTYREWALRAIKDAGMTDAYVESEGHGTSISVMAIKNGKKHVGWFHVNGSVMADIWKWAKAF